jgi:ATP-dependent DNA helicase PIF1
MTSQSITSFKRLERPLHFEDDLAATELFPTRSEVDRANTLRMQQLPGEVRIFEAKDGGSIQDINFRNKLLSNCMAPEQIMLKKGAQVMLIKNVDETLVNGSLGRVIGFMSEATFDHYHEHEEEYIELQAVGEEDLNPAQKKLKARLQNLANTSLTYPLVRFAIADGTTRELLCTRESWKVELPNGEVQASRSQIPLILAWALSIHKAQGQTLERVKVDLGRVFEKGQAYVALSRATSMKGLQVLRFDPKKVVAHERVRHFYSKLQRAEQAASESRDAAKKSKDGIKIEDYEQSYLGDDSGIGDESGL